MQIISDDLGKSVSQLVIEVILYFTVNMGGPSHVAGTGHFYKPFMANQCVHSIIRVSNLNMYFYKPCKEGKPLLCCQQGQLHAMWQGEGTPQPSMVILLADVRDERNIKSLGHLKY